MFGKIGSRLSLVALQLQSQSGCRELAQGSRLSLVALQPSLNAWLTRKCMSSRLSLVALQRGGLTPAQLAKFKFSLEPGSVATL